MARPFRERAFASLGAVVGLFALPAAYLALEEFGPASRVLYYPYLFDASLLKFLLACGIGLALGAEVYRFLRFQESTYLIARLTIGCVLGSGLGMVASVGVALLTGAQPGWGSRPLFAGIVLAVSALSGWGMGILFFKSSNAPDGVRRVPWVRLGGLLLWLAWCLAPHFRAFPRDGSLAQRDAWARRYVRDYGVLVNLVTGLSEVQQDVGRVVEIAPTSQDKHIAGQDMDGDHLTFALEVVGEKDSGVFRTDCWLSQGILTVWRPGRWMFHGKERMIPAPPPAR